MRVSLGRIEFERLDTSGDEPLLVLSVRRWLRWRTEEWGRRTMKRICSGCGCQHDFWFRMTDGADLACVDDRRLNGLLHVRSHTSASGVPDNVVPLHRGGLYR